MATYVLLAVLMVFAPSGAVNAQSTAFTYQGQLTDAGAPATGTYDLQFKLFDDPNAGTQKGGTVTKDNVSVANGVFTTQLDFGGVFDGGARYLEIGVRPGTSTGGFQMLLPRQAVTATPYALSSGPWVTSGGNLHYNSGNVGIGTTNPLGKLHVKGPAVPAPGSEAIFDYPDGAIRVTKTAGVLSSDDLGIWNRGGSGGQPFGIAGWGTGNGMYIDTSNGNVGIGTTTPQARLEVVADIRFQPTFAVAQGQPGVVPLCQYTFNNDMRIMQCPVSSSLRYKSNVTTFPGGLEIVKRLRPISFTWKQSGMPDIGLAAEEVERVEPLLIFRKDGGEIEGVKYNQLSAVFINAIKEQQALIEQQQKQIVRLKKVFAQQGNSVAPEITALRTEVQQLRRANAVLAARLDTLETPNRLLEARLTALEEALQERSRAGSVCPSSFTSN